MDLYYKRDVKIPRNTEWLVTPLFKIISEANQGDVIRVDSADELACSIRQIIEIFLLVRANQVTLIIEDTGRRIFCHNTPEYLLRTISMIESQFISRRTTEALARRKAKGLHLGRPLGRKNSAYKLDAHSEQIYAYVKLGISKASIAKLVGCHPQTLYNWLDKKGEQE